MPLTVPDLDDRSYKDFVREALSRIPVHNPEWTNFNDSDPGVTLLQLFAFMSESLLYRANQIPDRSRLKFLTLLGIPLRPAAAAQGFVTIRNEHGPLTVVELDDHLDVRAGAVRFQTTGGLYVLPVEARVFYKQQLPPAQPDDAEGQALEDLYRRLYADLLEDGAQPAFYQTVPLPQPSADGTLPVVDVLQTLDRCLWIALLARKNETTTAARAAIAGKTLTVGVMPMLSADGIRVPAGSETPAVTTSRVLWEIADTSGSPKYATLPSSPTVDILNEPGLVELTLPSTINTWDDFAPGDEGTGDYPPSLVDTDFGDRVLTWIRMRIPDQTTTSESATTSGTAQALISWLDINASAVVQQTQIVGEILGTGSGEPDQCLTTANTPIIPNTLKLTVAGEDWNEIDDLLAAPPEVQIDDPRLPLYEVDPSGSPQVYTLDPESGQICFGDGAHGMRPRPGDRIVVSYNFGGGRQGNVGAGSINRSPVLPAGFKVENPLRTWGGDDAEMVDSAEKSIPRQIQHRDRLVSVQDFKDITWRTPGVDLGRVEVLPLYDPVSDLENVPGIVTVMVVPLYDPLAPDAPTPDRFFLDTVCQYLQVRRLITTELHIRGPIYRDVVVSVGVQLVGGRAAAPVLEAVKQRLRDFLSPLKGGRDGTGWPLDTPVLERELEAIVANVDGVRLVSDLQLGYVENGAVTATDPVTIQSLELPRLIAVDAVDLDTAPSLDSLLAAPSVTGQAATPIPVVPKGC